MDGEWLTRDKMQLKALWNWGVRNGCCTPTMGSFIVKRVTETRAHRYPVTFKLITCHSKVKKSEIRNYKQWNMRAATRKKKHLCSFSNILINQVTIKKYMPQKLLNANVYPCIRLHTLSRLTRILFLLKRIKKRFRTNE